jgi:hypothetical protein
MFHTFLIFIFLVSSFVIVEGKSIKTNPKYFFSGRFL